MPSHIRHLTLIRLGLGINMTTKKCCGRIRETLWFKCNSVAKVVRNWKSVLHETAKNAPARLDKRVDREFPPQRVDVSRHKVVCDRLTGSAGRSAGKQGSCNAAKIRSSDSAGRSRVVLVHQPHRNAVLSRHPPRPTPDCGPALRPPFDCRSRMCVGTV